MDIRVRTKPVQYISEKRLRVMMGDASAASIWRWTKGGILPPPRQLRNPFSLDSKSGSNWTLNPVSTGQ